MYTISILSRGLEWNNIPFFFVRGVKSSVSKLQSTTMDLTTNNFRET